MNTQTTNNGPGTIRHNQSQSAPYWDGRAEVNLDKFEEHLQRLAGARVAIGMALQARMAANNIPHSHGIDALLKLMPAVETISLLHRNRNFCCQHELEIQDSLAALEACSTALEAADLVFNKFLRRPSSTNPAEFDRVALLLEKALADLEIAYED